MQERPTPDGAQWNGEHSCVTLMMSRLMSGVAGDERVKARFSEETTPSGSGDRAAVATS